MAPGPTRIVSVVTPAAALFSGGQPIDLVALADVKLELGLTETADDAWFGKDDHAAVGGRQRLLSARARRADLFRADLVAGATPIRGSRRPG